MTDQYTTGIRSVYQNPDFSSETVVLEGQISSASLGALNSLKTFSPTSICIGWLNMGPSNTKL